MAKLFAAINIGNVDFDRPQLRTEERIAQGYTGVSEGGAIDHDALDTIFGQCRDVINQRTFVVALKKGELGLISEVGGELGFQAGQSGGAVDLGFAFTEAIEVGTVEDGDAFHGLEESGSEKDKDTDKDKEKDPSSSCETGHWRDLQRERFLGPKGGFRF